MGRERVTDPGADARLSPEGLLLRAALLAGYGAQARAIAGRLGAALRAEGGRSCLERGATIQLTVDAPGPVGLRAGIRLGGQSSPAVLEGLVSEAARSELVQVLHAMPEVTHDSLGQWLFWTPERQSLFFDLRDPRPEDALARAARVVPAAQWRERLAWLSAYARPWALRVELDRGHARRIHLHWLVARNDSLPQLAERLSPGDWPRVLEVARGLLRAPGRSGRWVVATPLDDESPPGLRVGGTGWALVPEHDDQKKLALARAVEALGGPRDHAEALWSLCRQASSAHWRVGRALELRVVGGQPRLRVFMVPETGVIEAGADQIGPTADTRISEADTPDTSSDLDVPSSA